MNLNLAPSIDLATDLAALQDKKVNGIVMYETDTTLVLLQLDPDAVIRDESEVPGWVIWSYASTIHPKIDNYVDLREGHSTFEYRGQKWPFDACEIEDVSPFDQSDLSNPGAVAANPPNVYPTIADMWERWREDKDGNMGRMLKNFVGGPTGIQ